MTYLEARVLELGGHAAPALHLVDAELEGHVHAVQEVPAEDQRVQRREDRVDPACARERANGGGKDVNVRAWGVGVGRGRGG